MCYSVCRPVADWAKANGAKQILFISSAGIYKSSFEQPHVEGVSFLSTVLYQFCESLFCLVSSYGSVS